METILHERQPQVGEPVIFFDSVGMRHNALLTSVHGERTITTIKEEGKEPVDKEWVPSVNLLVISPDKQRTDTWGRQIERFSSVGHFREYGTWGNIWCFSDELDDALVETQEAANKHNAKEK